jgi:hypothetical protein
LFDEFTEVYDLRKTTELHIGDENMVVSGIVLALILRNMKNTVVEIRVIWWQVDFYYEMNKVINEFILY